MTGRAIVLLLLLFVAVVLGVAWLDHRQLEARHCRPTDEHRLETVPTTVFVGKQVVIVPTAQTVRRYRCDDGDVWR